MLQQGSESSGSELAFAMDKPPNNGICQCNEESHHEGMGSMTSIRTSVHQIYASNIPTVISAAKEQAIGLSNYAWPHVTYVGDEYEQEPVRTVFVGKATAGWGEAKHASLQDFADPEGDVFTAATRMPEDFVRRVAAGEYSSSFWHRVKKIVTEVTPARAGIEPLSRIAWTNVHKIGGTAGNPDRRMCGFLHQHMNWLRAELDILRPQLVFFSTGSTYDEYLREMLDCQLIDIEGKIKKVIIPSRPTFLAFRSPHFQTMSNSEVDDLCHIVRRELGTRDDE